MKKLFACLSLVLAFSFAFSCSAAEKMNLNSATEKELAADANIGPDLAAKIVELRENMGDFQKYEDLKEIQGVDDAKIKAINEHFEIKGVASFDCNC